MAEYTEKWKKYFEKKYSKAIKELQSLENEYREMVETNPNEWISAYPDESVVYFGLLDDYWTSHYKKGEDEENPQEYVSLSLNSKLGNFSFRIETLEQLIKLRNDLLEFSDKFSRTEDPVKKIDPNECEDEEGWEDNEETEYTIQASRTCVQTWTHTVMARTECEAIRKIQEDDMGETHDQNDDFTDYGEIDYEGI
jgi:hypothetical protein